jgi:hypothetical protein
MPEERSAGPTREMSRRSIGEVTASGVWLNTRAVSSIDIPFKHELTPINDGWRIEATTNGKLTINFTDGNKQRYDLVAGDSLSASGEQMYLRLSGPAIAQEQTVSTSFSKGG